MSPSDEQLERPKPTATGIESYRRLIELQKQMIVLSQQHERARRECEALRDTVAREVAARPGLLARWRAVAARWRKHSPLALARQLFS